MIWDSVDINNQIEVVCDQCGAVEYQVVLVKEGFRYVRCRTCSQVYVNPRLGKHINYQATIGEGCYVNNDPPQKDFSKLLEQVRSIECYRKINRVIDVGAGRGWFLRAAAKEGWETWAVEINRFALEILAQAGLDKIIAEPALEFEAPPESADVVRLWDVMAHLESPRRAVEHVYKILRPGGLLLISTLNFASLSRWVSGPNWVLLNGADHITVFEPQTIRGLLTDVGYRILSFKTKGYKPQSQLYFSEQKLPLPGPIFYPFRNIIHGLIRFTQYGHYITVQAQKPESPT